MCQGLPFWAQGGPSLLSPCNNYKLQRTQSDPLYSCRFTYTDCYGVRNVIDLNPTDNPIVYVCATGLPTFSGPGNPTPVNPTGTATLVNACGGDDNNTPSIPCAQEVSYNGGQAFPSIIRVDLGTSVGTVTLSYQAYDVPDKFVVKTVETVKQTVIDTGYRGASVYQNSLNNALAERGLISEIILGGGTGTASFTKTEAFRYVDVYVYAPLTNTAWTFTLSCAS